MCKLSALSSDMPPNVTFSLGVFGKRGGRMGPHKDGWGIAFKAGRYFRLMKEAEYMSASACLRFIESHEFRSEIVLSHLRLASMPLASFYINTHPFARELYGACHVFAHNGNIPGVLRDIRLMPTWNFPLGETDSERAFCTLLDRLRSALAPDDVLNVSKKLPIIQDWATELAQHGAANFLLFDSATLYAHRSTSLFYVDRQCVPGPESFGSASLRVAQIPAQSGPRHVSLIATQPLTTGETWRPLPLGKVVALQLGRRIFET